MFPVHIKLTMGVLALFIWSCSVAVSSPPKTPTALRLMVMGSTVHLNWTPPQEKPGEISGYDIARAELFGGPFVVIGSVDGGTFQYVDTTAPSETILYYKVRARSGVKVSDYSQPVSGERPAAPSP